MFTFLEAKELPSELSLENFLFFVSFIGEGVLLWVCIFFDGEREYFWWPWLVLFKECEFGVLCFDEVIRDDFFSRFGDWYTWSCLL